MLLREFSIGNHTISLIQDGALYKVQVLGSGGERVFNQEYKDYERIKICFDEIIKTIDGGKSDIQAIITILERGTV